MTTTGIICQTPIQQFQMGGVSKFCMFILKIYSFWIENDVGTINDAHFLSLTHILTHSLTRCFR